MYNLQQGKKFGQWFPVHYNAQEVASLSIGVSMKKSNLPGKHKPNWEALLNADAGLELKEVGRLLAEARRRREMSVSELAVRIGVDRRTLGQLEKGSPKVSLGIFFQVLSALNLLRGIAEALKPENDLEAISLVVRRARTRRGTPRKISDEKVNF
jgi:transcriptional regulator with XRE-family HTH domain